MIYRVLSAIVALGFLFTPAALWLAGERPHAIENRPLAPAPRWSEGWSAFDELAPWASDHLPGRANAVHAKAWSDYFVLRGLPSTATTKPGPGTISTPHGPMLTAPSVVRGKNGELFLGRDFDRACASSKQLRSALRRFARLARLIADSGRKVAFYVGPDKSSVAIGDLPRVLPHGQCAARGLKRADHTLDTFSDPRFLPLREELAREDAAGKQVYWHTDTHWSTPGSAVMARRLADELQPGFGDTLTATTGTRTRLNDLMTLIGLTARETAPSTVVSAGGAVVEDPGSIHYDSSKLAYGKYSWTVRGGDPLPGRTALVGDSFTYYALDNLRPLFADGEFFWFNHGPTQAQVVDGIVHSDTVVLEVVERELVGHGMISGEFIDAVRSALAKDERRTRH